MKNKKIIIIVIIAVILIGVLSYVIFFRNNTAKNLKIGNNTTSQEIVDFILNMTSYEAKIEVDVQSNKNESKYILKQNYNGEEDNCQEVLEPSNIAGVKLIRNGNVLKLENTELNLTSIFENYQYVADSCLDLSSFVKDYKQDQKASWEEKNEKIIMQAESQGTSKKQKKLYIDKKTGKPEKMELQETNKKTVIYILYNEITVNS